MQPPAGTIMNQLQTQPVSIQMQNASASQVNAPAVSMAAAITAVASPQNTLQPVAGSTIAGITAITTAAPTVPAIAQANGTLHIGSQITCMPVDAVKEETKVG